MTRGRIKPLTQGREVAKGMLKQKALAAFASSRETGLA